ncbi:MAG: hypothetical protein ACRBF0_04815 [Calditrichia bacterium]
MEERAETVRRERQKWAERKGRNGEKGMAEKKARKEGKKRREERKARNGEKGMAEKKARKGKKNKEFRDSDSEKILIALIGKLEENCCFDSEQEISASG